MTAPQFPTVADLASLHGAPDFSLVGGDAVQLVTSNFFVSAVGAFQPGKVRVTFDVAMINRLANIRLSGPTVFPSPPPGSTGPLLFPYDIAVATTSGGVSGQGGDVIVVLPGGGLVAPSAEWDGSPFNFFNDSACGGNDCYRWEEFPVLQPGTTSAARQVGFDIDPTVGQFTARLIVASDLIDTALPTPGSVQGVVASTGLGPIAGALVTATPGGATAVTAANGAFQIAGLSPGTVTLDVTGLPSICTPPGSSTILIAPSTVTTVAISVTCTPPALTGSVVGQVTLTGGPGLGSVGIVLTPTGGTALPMVLTDTTGNFTVPNVPVSDGTGSYTLVGLPSSCTDPGAVPYTGLTIGGTTSQSVAVDCVTTGSGYQYTAGFGSAGATVTLSLAVDMSPYNDLLVNGVGPDDIQAIQGDISYDPARLQLVGCTAVPLSALASLTVNTSAPGTIQFINVTTVGGPVVGHQGIADCSFTDLGGGPVTTLTTLSLARSFDGHDLLPHMVIAEATLP